MDKLVFETTPLKEDFIFLDFDHTLFGANSTELFISRCRPRPFVALLDMFARECIPWRRLGFRRYYRVRDYVCVTLLLILTPWNLRSWKADAKALWTDYGQADFDSLLAATGKDRVAVVSFGMEALIAPLLSASEWRGVQIMATPRRASREQLAFGKLDMVRASDRADEIQGSAFITDSEEDADLLREAARPIRIEPRGQSFRAMERLYFPLRYTMRAKYPFKYFIDQTLFVDVAIAVVATSSSLGSLLTNTAVIVPLYLAFLCIYEIGYYENDFVGATREAAPSLTPQVARYKDYPIRHAWPWALSLTLCGAFIAWWISPSRLSTSPVAMAAIWLTVMVAARGVFFVYNRSTVDTRLFLYPLLQLIKYASILLILPLASSVGEAVVMAQIVVMTTVYLVYRAAAQKPNLNKEIMRLIVVAMIVAVQAAGGRRGLVDSSLFGWIVPVAWLGLRNLKPILLR